MIFIWNLNKLIMMKYILIFITLLAAKTFGQVTPTPVTYTPMLAGGYQFKFVKDDSGHAMPFVDTVLGRNIKRPGLIVARPLDSLPYWYNGRYWVLLGTSRGGDSLTTLQEAFDNDLTAVPKINGHAQSFNVDSTVGISLLTRSNAITGKYGGVSYSPGSYATQSSTPQSGGAYGSSIISNDSTIIGTSTNNARNGRFKITPIDFLVSRNNGSYKSVGTSINGQQFDSSGNIDLSLVVTNPPGPFDAISDTMDHTPEFVVGFDVGDTLKKAYFRVSDIVGVDTAYATNDTTLHFKKGLIEWDVLLTKTPVAISVDGVTITGDGTPGDPLTATGGGSSLANFYLKDSSLSSDRIVDLNSHTLKFRQGSDDLLNIDGVSQNYLLQVSDPSGNQSEISGAAGGTNGQTVLGAFSATKAASITETADGSSGTIAYLADTHTFTGAVTIGGVTYPTSDGTTGQVITTDGSGIASWADVTGGGGGGSSPLANFYLKDSTLSSDRSVNLNSHFLKFSQGAYNPFIIDAPNDTISLRLNHSGGAFSMVKVGDNSSTPRVTIDAGDPANGESGDFTFQSGGLNFNSSSSVDDRSTTYTMSGGGITTTYTNTTSGANSSIQMAEEAGGHPYIDLDVANADGTTISGLHLKDTAIGFNTTLFRVIGADGTPFFKIAGAGQLTLDQYGAGTATFDASGNITSVSDERLKNIQGFYKSGLKEILKINPIYYKWNKLSGNEMDSTYAGFSAQNVRANIPLGTGVNKKGYLSLQDRAIMATLVNAIKEQQAEIEHLKQKLNGKQ